MVNVVEYAMSEPTHSEDDRPSEGRYVAALSRPGVQRMQEHDRYRLVGGCGIPIWNSSILRQELQKTLLGHSWDTCSNNDLGCYSLENGSLQMSRDMACQAFNSNRIEGCLTPDDTGANRGVPPWNARRKVSKSNFFMILHPFIGNLRNQSIDLHPSVGYFKREVGSEYLRHRRCWQREVGKLKT